MRQNPRTRTVRRQLLDNTALPKCGAARSRRPGEIAPSVPCTCSCSSHPHTPLTGATVLRHGLTRCSGSCRRARDRKRHS